jgi:hypothetical protein
VFLVVNLILKFSEFHELLHEDQNLFGPNSIIGVQFRAFLREVGELSHHGRVIVSLQSEHVAEDHSIRKDVESRGLIVLFCFKFLKDRPTCAFEISVRLIVTWR